MSTPKIPKGWRKLTHENRVRRGDRYVTLEGFVCPLNNADINWRPMKAKNPPRWGFYIRRIRKAARSLQKGEKE